GYVFFLKLYFKRSQFLFALSLRAFTIFGHFCSPVTPRTTKGYTPHSYPIILEFQFLSRNVIIFVAFSIKTTCMNVHCYCSERRNLKK
ncbi:MAG: hypothetical protein CL913_02205, partial [Deltaproteobacteria bacterium]|nr:hypothetical protein [Deltaproteobacteria bacterium]